MGYLSKLDAVNRILRAAGEYPVSTLSGSGINDTVLAEALLDEVVTQIQLQGTEWNEYHKQFSPDANGNIILPTDTLFVDAAGSDYYRRIVSRGTPPRLHDMDDEATDIFTAAVWLKIVRRVDFADMPTADQFFATDTAARIYQNNTVGDPNSDAQLGQIANASRSKARSQEIRSRSSSFLPNNPGYAAATLRPSSRLLNW